MGAPDYSSYPLQTAIALAPSTPSTLNFGAVCENPNTSYTGARAAYCYAPEWAITNYVEHNFWNNVASLNIRNEIVDDIKGQRTGPPRFIRSIWRGSISGRARR